MINIFPCKMLNSSHYLNRDKSWNTLSLTDWFSLWSKIFFCCHTMLLFLKTSKIQGSAIQSMLYFTDNVFLYFLEEIINFYMTLCILKFYYGFPCYLLSIELQRNSEFNVPPLWFICMQLCQYRCFFLSFISW